ncbi:MAG: hypothetical protein KIS76_10900 [Pyrinomonadaceae bacterium]|nr:hypothetical protein [Pyrinomonadaceae bacterium]
MKKKARAKKFLDIRQKLCTFVLIAVFLAPAPAFETDQYNRPEKPLADIGDEVAEYVSESVRETVEKLNSEIEDREACAAKPDVCSSVEKARERLRYLRSEEALARGVFKILGGGIPPSTRSGTWMQKHKFKAQPARFKTSFSDSIYKIIPTSYLTISETVKIYGTELGTDKIAHIFQQGYEYYKIRERALEKGKSEEQATGKAVKYGKRTEATYYGYFVSGVYSNGDLAANYAGMKFYQNLLHRLEIGDKTYQPIVKQVGGVWKINDRGAPILEPFITDHLNEALNPSVYFKLFWLDSCIRNTVKKKSCAGWKRDFPNKTRADFEAETAALTLWNGEDYGHKDSSHFITIANSCFDNATE